MEDVLANYYSLVNKVDDLCRQIETEFSDQLACHSGCSSCCRHITLAWVEAMALATALQKLPPNEVEAIRLRAQYAKPNGPCPLLVDDRCAMYDYRPIICRTHGLPILREEAGKGLIDYCPSNFQGVETLPGNAVIDLDRLNTLLDSINRVFINEFFASKPEQERLTIAEALLLEIDTTGDTT
ncbi:flagellin N-methylase [Geobacter sp. OR-1]|uniref:YkgJ family cysteine cluster protein n=1 Tax=Geobacter sp. OR-1 TaxID=1266765 RepID=UPI000542D867|nr:zinc/iron-chelating domain-containing protein [Geobacter sp. OR-1]GAM09775.1 flagellin N-methylase [Geobacter sp. OR-1]